MADQAQLINSDYQRSLLSGLELFQNVRPEDVQDLLRICERRDVEVGAVLLSPGTKNEHVFVILSGSLNVQVGSSDTPDAPDAPIIATMDTGACVGEMSIIEDKDPSAYVVAAEATHLLAIHKSVLWQMVDASHEFAKNLLLMLSERVRSHNHFIAASFGELRKYERNATTDALTGLGNRHAMEEDFPRVVARCLKAENVVSLIMIDVDNFKEFNDRFGHVAGDRALCAVARVLKKQFRTLDLLVRFGGDEFAVLLPNVDAAEAMEIADRARIAVTGDFDTSEDSLIKIPVAISLGVADIGPHGSYKALLQAADKALYRAKHAGRNRVSN